VNPPHGGALSSGGEVEENYIIAYDLPSENYKHIVNTEAYVKVRAVRVSSTYRLHSLGIESTESVILVSPSKNQYISEVVNSVYRDYNELNKWLREKGYIELPNPLIKVIKLTSEQKEDFKTLAERKLKERLDSIIESLANLINEVENIIEEEKRKRIEYNLRKQQKELEKLEKLAKELGVESNHKFELLTQLYNNAYEKLKGGEI